MSRKLSIIENLSLLLILVHVASPLSKNSRDGPMAWPRQWPIRRLGLSEFLVPPPAPLFRGPPALPPIPSHQSPPNKFVRNGRYINRPAPPPPSPPKENSASYFSKLVSWFNPFGGGSHGKGKEQHGISGPPGNSVSNHPRPPQYQPPHPGPPLENATPRTPLGWLNGKSCNPCNQVPWMPVVHSISENTLTEFANHPVGDHYVSGGSQELPKQEYFPPPTGPYLNENPHSHDNVNQPNFNVNQHSYSNGNQPNYNENPHPYINENPSNYNENHNSYSNGNQPSFNDNINSYSNANQLNFNSPSFQKSEGQQNIHHDPISQQSQEATLITVHAAPPSNAGNEQQFPFHIDSITSSSILHEAVVSDSFLVEQTSPSPIYVRELEQNETKYNENSSPTYDSQEENLVNPDGTSLGDAIYGQKIPNDQIPQPQIKTTVHFQRSPLIDLTVVTSLTTESSLPTTHDEQYNTVLPDISSSFGTRTTLGKPVIKPSSLIDYIVSSSDEEVATNSRPIISTTTPNSSTLSSHQASFIESLVQSYELKKSKELFNDTGRENYHDTYDYGFTRVESTTEKSRGTKRNKVVQIIIPYTAQYTPSPFHPTAPTTHRNDKITQTEGVVGRKFPGTTSRPIKHEDNAVIEESRKIEYTHTPEFRTNFSENEIPRETKNAIDVHRLQKNIDNWTIQEYSKEAISKASKKPHNSTRPHLLQSKQIPGEYLLSAVEFDSEEDSFSSFNNFNSTESNWEFYRIPKKKQDDKDGNFLSTSAISIITAIYPKMNLTTKPHQTTSSSKREHVYVVTPVPTRATKSPRVLKEKDQTPQTPKQNETSLESIERVYQVLPQAVNNLAAVSPAPDAVIPSLWGIMEHEEFAASQIQPKWKTDTDTLESEVVYTPILYTGHSKVSRAR